MQRAFGSPHNIQMENENENERNANENENERRRELKATDAANIDCD